MSTKYFLQFLFYKKINEPIKIPRFHLATSVSWLKQSSTFCFSLSLTLTFFFLMVALTAHGSLWTRNKIWDIAATHTALHSVRSFNPLCLAQDRTCASAVTKATAVRFLTHCATAGTPTLTFLKSLGLLSCKILYILFPFWLFALDEIQVKYFWHKQYQVRDCPVFADAVSSLD